MGLKVCVIGAAKSGTATARLAIDEGFHVVLTDERMLEDHQELTEMGVIVYDGGFNLGLIDQDFDWVVKNPGVPNHHPFVVAMAKKNFIANEMEFAQRLVPQWKLGAITGTNGKTTTTAMLGEILKLGTSFGFVAGNIGIPLSVVVDENRHRKHAYGAIEVAAFQLINTRHFHPHVATIVSLAPDHLDVFKNVKEYYDAKWKIVDNLKPSDFFILNIDDCTILKTKKSTDAKIITVSVKQKADAWIQDGKAILNDVLLFDTKKLKVVGTHNITNALIAASMAFCMGIKPKYIQKALHGFKGVPHRIEYVDTVDDVMYFNDSKGTNPPSTKVAIEAFDRPVILLAGGYDKKLPFDELLPLLSKIKHMIVFGQTKHQLKELFPQAIVVNDLDEAVKQAHNMAIKGDIVCFSPACASFDQYDNFEQRGEHFRKLVEELRK
mgnify:CR=1 FL=1